MAASGGGSNELADHLGRANDLDELLDAAKGTPTT